MLAFLTSFDEALNCFWLVSCRFEWRFELESDSL